MNVLSAPRLVLLAVLAAGSFAASAQTSVGVSVEAGASAAVPGEQINVADKPATHPFCLRTTGSRIPVRARVPEGASSERPACLPYNGRVYTQHDLQMTGAIDIADALRRLDPSIR